MKNSRFLNVQEANILKRGAHGMPWLTFAARPASARQPMSAPGAGMTAFCRPRCGGCRPLLIPAPASFAGAEAMFQRPRCEVVELPERVA